MGKLVLVAIIAMAAVGLWNLRQFGLRYSQKMSQCSDISTECFNGNLHGARAKLALNGGRPCTGEWSSLIAAVCGRNPEIVRLMLDHGADPNERENSSGQTPLIMAAMQEDPSLVKLLLSRGADPRPQDGAGYSGLTYAAMYGEVEVVKSLIARPYPRLRDDAEKALQVADKTLKDGVGSQERNMRQVVRILTAFSRESRTAAGASGPR